MWGIKWIEAHPTSYQTTSRSVQLRLSKIMPIYEYYTKTPAGRIMVNIIVAETRRKLASGSDLGTAIRADGIFPLALVQVFTLGQNTGELDDLLFQIAEDYDHQVGMLGDRLTTIMEPILIIGLSVIVGFILLATLLPILETGNVLSES